MKVQTEVLTEGLIEVLTEILTKFLVYLQLKCHKSVYLTHNSGAIYMNVNDPFFS